MKARMRSEMEGEVRRRSKRKSKNWYCQEEDKLLHITVSKKDAQHKQIQLGHPTDVQLLSTDWKMSSSCFQAVIKKVPRCH